MRSALLALLFTAALLHGADRVVLLEDFTNCGCGECWEFAPDLDEFVAAHVAAGDLAPIRVHVSWPDPYDPVYLANTAEQNERRGFYGITWIPSVRIDGVAEGYPDLESAFFGRIFVPAHISIFAARNGDSQTGSISIGVVAEQAPENSVEMRLFATIVENGVPGTGYWEGGQFRQAFRDNLFGLVGPVVDFSPPYPDTIYYEAVYDVSEWEADSLHLAAFVQEYGTSERYVMNAFYEPFLGLGTGITEGAAPEGSLLLSVSPSPTAGPVLVRARAPAGKTGRVGVFDLAGRMLRSWDFSGRLEATFTPPEAGVYLVRLQCGGRAVAEPFVSVR